MYIEIKHKGQDIRYDKHEALSVDFDFKQSFNSTEWG